MLWMIVAIALDRMLLRLTAPQYRNNYFQSGYASIDRIANRDVLAPMAYRALFPVIITGLERMIPTLRSERLPALYEPLRILFLAAALWMAEMAIGTTGAMVVAVLLVATFYFDYWDFAVELFAFACALTGNLQLVVLGTGLAAFSRMETAGLVLLTYGLVTGDVQGSLLVAAAAVVPILAIRVWAGNKALYCGRNMLRRNWQDVRELLCNRPFYLSEIAMTLLITGLTVAVALSGRAGKAWIVPMALLGMGWYGGRAAETRIFTPCLLWIGMALV